MFISVVFLCRLDAVCLMSQMSVILSGQHSENTTEALVGPGVALIDYLLDIVLIESSCNLDGRHSEGEQTKRI